MTTTTTTDTWVYWGNFIWGFNQSTISKKETLADIVCSNLCFVAVQDTTYTPSLIDHRVHKMQSTVLWSKCLITKWAWYCLLVFNAQHAGYCPLCKFRLHTEQTDILSIWAVYKVHCMLHSTCHVHMKQMCTGVNDTVSASGVANDTVSVAGVAVQFIISHWIKVELGAPNNNSNLM